MKIIKKIMIVDDSYTARTFIRTCFDMIGWNEVAYVQAQNGQEALELLRKEKDVDLVVSDLNMPIMDGMELIRRIKASPLLTNMSLVVISSAATASKESELLQSGAVAVLNKPISPARLMKALESFTVAS